MFNKRGSMKSILLFLIIVVLIASIVLPYANATTLYQSTCSKIDGEYYTTITIEWYYSSPGIKSFSSVKSRDINMSYKLITLDYLTNESYIYSYSPTTRVLSVTYKATRNIVNASGKVTGSTPVSISKQYDMDLLF